MAMWVGFGSVLRPDLAHAALGGEQAATELQDQGHDAVDASMPPVQRPRALTTTEPVVVGPSEPVAATPAPASPAPASPAELPVAAQPIDDDSGIDPTVSALPAPRVHSSSASASGGGPTVHRQATPMSKRFSHAGFTVDARVGTLGCFRATCAADRHGARPGLRLDGFIGGNIRGWVDFGLAGGWGTMEANVAKGTNVLTLYGLDPNVLQGALAVLAGQALGINFASLAVNDAKLRSAQAGPLLRVHFIPRGRFAAWVGTGAYYNLFRGRYDTAGGAARVDFHGLAVPVEAGFAVHVHEHVAVGLQFDYLWTWYGLANLQQGAQAFTVPVRVLDEAAKLQNASLRSQLPQFWTFGLGLRARI
ncbi:MAG: hypothetical protein KBB21_30725 [Nannocystaceae bacterium]|nr:hypothetical protein [Deltaproteobacteria bacterium]MBP7291041.1 hypothetical protein [Nannocystaceae bacterium]